MEQSSLAGWAALAASPPVDAPNAGPALLLWLILAAGLGIFLLGIVLVSLARRTRKPARPPAPSADLDAWQASADRVSTPRPPEPS